MKAWKNKVVADVHIEAALAQLMKPFGIDGFEPMYTAAAAKTVANALEWFLFEAVAPLPELELWPHHQDLLAKLRTEPKDWSFDFWDMHRRRAAYEQALKLMDLFYLRAVSSAG